MSGEARKRSRFDQTEPDPRRRKARLASRSRSPHNENGDNEARRSRSPAAVKDKSDGDGKKEAAVAAAAAAAARINAQLAQRKGIVHVDVPPIRSASNAANDSNISETSASKPMYTQDGDYIKDIEVNDLRNRYTLTKGTTQKELDEAACRSNSVLKEIKEETGADVTTRGSYYPKKEMATAANPPLYLHITSTTKEGLEKAVAKIEQLINQELPTLIDERRFRRRDTEQSEQQGRRRWPEERIPIDLEPIPDFNLRAAVVGSQGAHVKHIQNETRCRVQIKGRGSGFIEHDTGVESDENMYLHIAGPDPSQLERAKDLALSLLETVKDRYENHKERKARGEHGGNYGGYSGGRGDRQDRGDRGDRHDRHGSGNHSGHSGQQDHGYSQQDYPRSAQSDYQYSAHSDHQYPGQQDYQYSGQHDYPYTSQPDYGYSAQQAYANASAQAPPNPPADAGAQSAGMDAEQFQAWAAYYAANPSQDPYIQYGGFTAYMQMYSQYLATGQMQAGSPSQMNAASGAVPPPPPSSGDQNGSVPPPPPANGQNGGAYHAVPPPPGM